MSKKRDIDHEEILILLDKYLDDHIEEQISVDEVASYLGVSVRHLYRLFREDVNMTFSEYLLRYRIEKKAVALQKKEQGLIDSVPSCGFSSDEEFQSSFSSLCNLKPYDYFNDPKIHFRFLPDSVNKCVYNDLTGVSFVYVKTVSVKNCRMIFKRAVWANEYKNFVKECGREILGLFAGIDNIFNEPFCAWLPDNFNKPGYSGFVIGVFVSADSDIFIPDSCEIMDIPSDEYVLFNYKITDDLGLIGSAGLIWKAINEYDFAADGYERATDVAPRIQFAPFSSRGFCEGIPVRKIDTAE